MSRVCCKCGTAADLRPYGPKGAPICFPCMKSTPELEAGAKAQLAQIFDAISPGPAMLTPDGPKPLRGRSR